MFVLKIIILSILLLTILCALQYVFIVAFISLIVFIVIQIDKLKRRIRKWKSSISDY